MIYLFIFVPLIWFAFAKLFFKAKVTWQEAAICMGMALVIIIVCKQTSIGLQTVDSEIWNSRVEKKYKAEVSCEHSYQCNPHPVTTGYGKDARTTIQYDTCYEHDHDFDWVVRSSLDDIFRISRVDRRGVNEPPRWTGTAIGDPVAVSHMYTNWLKAVPESLFASKGNYDKYSVPGYPSGIYDYYNLDRVINPPYTAINKELSLALREMGPSAQANVILVFSKDPNMEYAYAVRTKWGGGKKNDVIVVANPGSWVKVFSLSTQAIFEVQLEKELLDAPIDKYVAIIKDNVLHNFKRKPMKDFAYLKAQIKMPIYMIALCFLLPLVGSVTTTVITNDWVDKLQRRRYRR